MRSSYPTRKWSHPEGYKYLAPWTNAVFLRFLIRKFTDGLPRAEHRTKTQLDDAGRSVVSNIEEGFKRPTTKEYLDFLGFSQGSLEEVKGLFRQVCQDGFLKSKSGSQLSNLGIDLKEIKGLLEESKGEVPLAVLYTPLGSLKRDDLTYEMFLELVNKTDYLLRQLVKSLENSITKEDVLSPYDRWLGKQMEQRKDEEKDFDEELKQIVERAKSEKGKLR